MYIIHKGMNVCVLCTYKQTRPLPSFTFHTGYIYGRVPMNIHVLYIHIYFTLGYDCSWCALTCTHKLKFRVGGRKEGEKSTQFQWYGNSHYFFCFLHARLLSILPLTDHISSIQLLYCSWEFYSSVLVVVQVEGEEEREGEVLNVQRKSCCWQLH